MLLPNLPLHTTGIITKITGPRCMRNRLSAIQITVGCKLQLCNRVRPGIIVLISGTRLAIDPRVAEHIHVELEAY